MNLVHVADSVKLVDYIPIRGRGGGTFSRKYFNQTAKRLLSPFT